MKSITHNKLKTLSKYVQNFPIPVILGYGSTSRNRRLLIKDVEAKQLVLPIVVYAEEDGLIYVKPEKGENITYGVLQNIYTTMGEYFAFIIENKGGQDYAPSKIYMKSYKNIFGTPGVGGKKALYGLRFCRNDRKMERLAQNYRFYREKFLQNEGITDFSKKLLNAFSHRGDLSYYVGDSGEEITISFIYEMGIYEKLLNWVVENYPD